MKVSTPFVLTLVLLMFVATNCLAYAQIMVPIPADAPAPWWSRTEEIQKTVMLWINFLTTFIAALSVFAIFAVKKFYEVKKAIREYEASAEERSLSNTAKTEELEKKLEEVARTTTPADTALP